MEEISPQPLPLQPISKIKQKLKVKTKKFKTTLSFGFSLLTFDFQTITHN